MYLLLYSSLDEKQMEWLIRNALPVSPLAWIHNSTVEGTVAVRIGSQSYKSLRDQIDHSTSIYLNYIESKIQTASFRGISKRLAINKLRVITEVCQEMELIGWAKDLMFILGEHDEYESKPNAIEKQTNLGLDKDTVENYLLELAKKPTIH